MHTIHSRVCRNRGVGGKVVRRRVAQAPSTCQNVKFPDRRTQPESSEAGPHGPQCSSAEAVQVQQPPMGPPRGDTEGVWAMGGCNWDVGHK